MEECEILSLLTADYIGKANVTSVDDLNLTHRLNDIILYEKENKYWYNFNHKYKLSKSFKYAYEFLKSINPKYAEYLLEKADDGTIYFDGCKGTTGGAYCDIDSKTNKSIIYIPVNNTIEDSFKIIHELFHEMNIDRTFTSITRQFFTEGLSFLGELLLEEYLVKNKVRDAKVNNNLNLYYLKSKAIEVDFNIELISNYLEYGIIDESNLFKIISKYPENYAQDLENIIYKICYNVNEIDENLTLDFEQNYIIGTLTACYMYDRIKQNQNNLQELFELNSMITKYSFEDVLDYLELEYNDTDLTNESYDKLRSSYKKVLKRN